MLYANLTDIFILKVERLPTYMISSLQYGKEKTDSFSSLIRYIIIGVIFLPLGCWVMKVWRLLILKEGRKMQKKKLSVEDGKKRLVLR